MNSFGWRFMPLVFGTLLVFITIRLARRLSRSTLIGGDRRHPAHLRRAGVRDVAHRAARHLPGVLPGRRRGLRRRRPRLVPAPAGRPPRAPRASPTSAGAFGPLVWWRPWRLAAGVLFGLAHRHQVELDLRAGRVRRAQRAVGRRRAPPGRRRLARRGWRCWSTASRRSSGWSWCAVRRLRRDLVGLAAHLRRLRPRLGRRTTPTTRWTSASRRRCGRRCLKYHQEIYDFHTGDYINERRPTPTTRTRPAGW